MTRERLGILDLGSVESLLVGTLLFSIVPSAA